MDGLKSVIAFFIFVTATMAIAAVADHYSKLDAIELEKAKQHCNCK